MRHQNKGRELGRISSQRKALFRTMLGSLIMHEKIETTEAKAKELKSKLDQLVNKAKKGKDPLRKVAIARDLRKAIPLIAVKKLMGTFLERLEKRNSGYSRIIKLAPRKSDSARMAIIEFVD